MVDEVAEEEEEEVVLIGEDLECKTSVAFQVVVECLFRLALEDQVDSNIQQIWEAAVADKKKNMNTLKMAKDVEDTSAASRDH